MRPLVLVMTEGARGLARRKLRNARGSFEAAQALLRHTLDVATAVGDVRVCAPAGSDAAALASERGLVWIRQGSGSLGARVGAALRDLQAQEAGFPPALARASRAEEASSAWPARPVLLIGDDCPGLTEECLAHALIELERGARSVVGRSRDGGFWLLGVMHWNERFAEALAARVEWCTPRAFDTLRKFLEQTFGETPSPLTQHVDLDAPGDLADAIRAAEPDDLRAALAAVRPGLEPSAPEEEPVTGLTVRGTLGLPRPPPRA